MVEQLESVESAARILSISPWTVRAFVRQGKIRPVRLGKRLLIESAELRRVIKNARRQSAQRNVGEKR